MSTCMFSTLTLSYSECVLVPRLNLIACIFLCCLKCMSCTEIHVMNIIIHSQSVKYLFVYYFNVTTSSSSRSSQRRGRTPPLRTEHRLAVENLSSRINWQVCATWCLQFVLSPYHQSSEFLYLLVFLWLLSPIGGESTYVIEMRACNDRIPILPGFYLMFPSATNHLFWSVKVV